MSDSNAFINNYIDVIIGTTHEQLNTIFQLKTKEKMFDGLIREKDETISLLQKQLDETKISNEENSEAKNSLSSEIETYKTQAKIWEDSYTAMKNKISHMDTLTNQLNEFKREIISKNNEVENLKKEIDKLKNKPKAKEPVKLPIEKELNNKSNTKIEEKVVSETKKLPILDDF